MNNIRQPAEPKPEVVECAIAQLLELAPRQGITPADFIQFAGPGNAHIRLLGSALRRQTPTTASIAIVKH